MPSSLAFVQFRYFHFSRHIVKRSGEHILSRVIPTLLLSLALSWGQVHSDVFVVKSSAGLDRAKRVLRELETFREVIGSTLVFQNVVLPELPIEVLVVEDDS